VCDLETSRMGAPYIYDISRLRVKRQVINLRNCGIWLVDSVERITGKFNLFRNLLGKNQHNSNNQNWWKTGFIARSEILTAVLLKFRSSGMW